MPFDMRNDKLKRIAGFQTENYRLNNIRETKK